MKLKARIRNAMGKQEFAMPSQKKYPINDASHAKNAKARASEMYNKGALSAAEKSTIDKKADKKLGIKEGSKKDEKSDKRIALKVSK